MRTEKFVWLGFMSLCALTFGAMVYLAPMLENKILAGFMCAVMLTVICITIKD